MGRLISGINGPFIGKVGPVIGSSRNGKFYIKGPYKKRTKKVSVRELANRKKFGLAQTWLKPLLLYVRAGFKGYSETAEGFIAAKSYLLRHAMVMENGEWQVLPQQMKVSTGTLSLPGAITVRQEGVDEVVFSWDPKADFNAGPFDQAMPLAYHTATRRAYFLTTGPFRAEGTLTLKLEQEAVGPYLLYLAFCAADRSSQSDSIYLGELVL